MVIVTRFRKARTRRRAARLPQASPVSTLDRTPAGQSVQVTEIDAGRGALLQLAQLGIRPGATLLVRRRAPLGGPLLVESGGSLVAVGRGMARKVGVRSLA